MDRTLTLDMLDSSPMTQFGRWFSEAAAAGLAEPNAMVLTTVGDRPHARTVLLKAHDAAGFTFYTNRTSRKGQDLAGVAIADRRLGVAPVAGARFPGGPRRPGREALRPLAGGDRGADARLLGRLPDCPR